MTECCGIDVRVFGHTACTLRPAWAVSAEAARQRTDAETAQRNEWSRAAFAEVKQAGETSMTAG